MLLIALALIGGCTSSFTPPRSVAPHHDGPILSRDISEGGRIFLSLCTACHRGRVNPRGYVWSPGQMRTQIREGNRLMPPLTRELLSDAQVEAVLAYLSVQGALEGELPQREQLEIEVDAQETGATLGVADPAGEVDIEEDGDGGGEDAVVPDCPQPATASSDPISPCPPETDGGGDPPSSGP